jgi:surface polysaccharide O-acyltransferase-like enzyme
MPVASSRREPRARTTPAFLPYADGIRMAAILAVVAVHSSGMAVVRYAALPPAQWWIANVIDSGCRWAVPVFVMLSGALMLDPARHERWTEFYGKRVQRLGVPLVFWTAFYLVWTSAFLGEHVTLRWVADKLYQGLTYNHLYFLFLILGLYAVTPVLRLVVERVGRPAEWGIAALALGLAAGGVLQDAIPSNAFTLFVPYVGYYAIGHVLADRAISRRGMALAIAAFLGATAVIAMGTASRFAQWGVDDWRVLALYDYLSPVVMVQSIAAFLALRGVFAHGVCGRGSLLTRQLGLAAFGIYLVHRVPLDVLHRHLGSMLATSALPVITTEVIVAYAVSAVVVVAMLRVPYVRRTVA